MRAWLGRLLTLMWVVVACHSGRIESATLSGNDEKKTKPIAHSAQTRPSRPRTAQTRPARVPSRTEKSLVFTDEDLKRYHSDTKSPSPRPSGAQVSPQDPLKPFRDREERARWRREKIASLQERVLDLEGKLRGLQQKRLSILNPLMPRPQAGEGGGEPAEGPGETGLSGPELLARADGEIKQTTDQLEAARKELAAFLEALPE